MNNNEITLCVIIPVHNEENTLKEIIRKVQAVDIPKNIIIIDDASSDSSPAIEEELVRTHNNIKLISHKKNTGKGGALQSGFEEAEGDYLIIQDADLEYDPKDYLPILEKAVEMGAPAKDVVIYGSRFLGENSKSMSFTHYWGNKSLTLITNLLYGVKVSDMETCYKLIPVHLAKNMKVESNRFNIEPEMTSKIAKRGVKIYEVPIYYDARAHDEGKHISWKDGFSAITTLFKYRFK